VVLPGGLEQTFKTYDKAVEARVLLASSFKTSLTLIPSFLVEVPAKEFTESQQSGTEQNFPPRQRYEL
jgi:hypothetical protein